MPVEKLPHRIKSSEVAQALESWLLPEVGSSHVVGLHAKPAEEAADDVSVVEDEIVAEKVTLAELESIRETAHDEGYESGRAEGLALGREEGEKKGFQEGMKNAEQRIEMQIGRFQELIKSLDTPLNKQHDEFAELVTLMALKVAEAITEHQVKEIPEIVQSAVSDAIAALPAQSGEMLVKVNSEDAETVQSALESQEKRWQLVTDDQITAGGCIIVTDNSVVDHCIERRFDFVAAELKQRLANSLGRAESGAASDQNNNEA